MEKYKKFIQNNMFKISAPTWNHELELTDGSYSPSDIKDYLKYIISLKHEAGSDNCLKTLYANKIENKIRVRIKTGYYFEFFMP